MADDWFRREVADGLQRIYALSLQGTPPAETLRLTAEAWVEFLVDGRQFVQERDTSRLRAAFRTLGQTAERWPAPKQLLAVLPAPREQLALPVPPPSEADKAAARALREKFRGLLNGMKPSAPPRHAPPPPQQPGESEDALLERLRAWQQDNGTVPPKGAR
jgi:hypothetical protein